MAQKFTVPVTIKQLSSAGSDAITVYVDADTYARLKIDAGGKLTWGSGSGTGDTTLYRSAADTLKTDDSFEATGSVTATGKVSTGSYLESTASAGNEGGEIQLAKPATNSSISGNVVIDIYQNQLRFFESTGTNRGAYIDITAASTGVGSNLLTGGGGGATTLDGLTDVTAPSPSSGDFLKYNGSAWVNDPIDLSTDTTGNYVASLVAGTNVTITNNSGEGATPTIAMSGTISSFDSISTPDWIQFDTSVGSPASTEGKLQWNSDFGTLSFGLEGNNSLQQIGINQFAYCYNAEATTLTKGEAVYIFGGQGSQVSIKRAENTSDTTSARTLGLVSESIASGASGYVCTYGVLQGINTTAYTVGDILYLGATAGALTTTAPSAPNHYVFIGVVIKAAVGGEIWIRPQNGYELGEIHNVQLSSLASGDFLKYNGTLWVNDPINLGTDTVGNYMTDVSAGTGVTVTHTQSEGSTATIAIGQAVATTDSPTFAGLTINGASVVFEGATANDFETTVTVTDPTADRTITLPDASGTVGLLGSIALGTDTTGNYMSDVSAGTGITITHTPGEGSTATIAVTANTYQPLDSELTALAGVTSGADKVPYFTGSGTADVATLTTYGRSLIDDVDASAARTTLGLGSISTLNTVTLGTDTTGNYVSTVNGSAGAITNVALTTGKLSQFAATTSAELLGVISDETGSGSLVFATSPTLVTPILGTPQSGDFSTGTFTWPTFNQNTTGSAAKWTTARTLSLGGDLSGSVSIDGSADATLTATIAANSVALGTDTTGNYVATITAGTGLNSNGATTGEGIAHTLSIDSTVATLTGSQTLTNKTLTSPSMSTVTVTSGGADITGTSYVRGSYVAGEGLLVGNTSVNYVSIFNTGMQRYSSGGASTGALSLNAAGGAVTFGGDLYNSSYTNYIEIGNDQSTGIGANTTNNTDNGVRLSGSGAIWASRQNGTLLILNRMNHTAGQPLVEFRTNGAAKGTITENAGTVSYNAFLGSHYTQIDGDVPLLGTVMESTGVLVDGWLSDQSRLPKCKVSDTAGSPAVFGIYFSENFDEDTPNGHLVASIGAAWVRMAAGSTPSLGDLIESNGDGCARVQEDTIIRSSTIGKLSSVIPAQTYEDGSYLLPCVLCCG